MLLVDRYVENIYLIMNFIVDILLIFLGIVFERARKVSEFKLSQSCFHTIVLLCDFVDNLEKFLDLERFIRFRSVLSMQFSSQTIYLSLLFVDDTIFQLARDKSTFKILVCSSFMAEF